MKRRRRGFGIAALFSAALIHAASAGAAAAAAQSAGLSIVVIEGEGAVNIIKQKTAVNPIVEVRDRSNLPVSGVAVTFSVGGQGASFAGGASTLTVTTNAAGRAVVAGLTPTATGAVTINASAIVNGQTIAATITQTNFATVAEAAASGAAAGGGGAASAAGAGAATGGGLGTGAIIGIVVGGVAVVGGAVVARGLNAADDETRVTVSCTFTVTPTTVDVPAAGGTVVITVNASPTGCVTPWNITNNATFVAADRTSGTGSGTVTLTIAANPIGPLGRSFAVAVAGTIVNFSQLGPQL